MRFAATREIALATRALDKVLKRSELDRQLSSLELKKRGAVRWETARACPVMIKKSAVGNRAGRFEMLPLTHAVHLQEYQDVMSPLWAEGRDRTWEAIKPYISTSAGEIRDFDLSAVSRDLEISVADLEKIVGWARAGHYQKKLISNCAFGRFWIAPVDPPPRAAEAEKLKVRNAEDLRANFRRRV